MTVGDLDRTLQAWFERVEARTEPPLLLDHVFAATARTTQPMPLVERARRLWRAAMDMPTIGSSPLGRLATLAIVIVAALSIVGLGVEGASFVAGQPTPVPSRAPAASAAPRPSGPAASFGRAVIPAAVIDIGRGPAVGPTVGTNEAAWLASGRLVLRIDGLTGVASEIAVGSPTSEIIGLGASSDAIFALTRQTISKIDRRGVDAVGLVPLDFAACCGLDVVDDTTLWVGEAEGVNVVDPRSGAITFGFDVPRADSGQVGLHAFGDLWIWDGPRSFVERIDPTSHEVVTRIPVSLPDRDVACELLPVTDLGTPKDLVLLACRKLGNELYDRFITPIDPTTNGRLMPVDIGGDWWTHVAFDGGLWFWRLDRDPDGHEATPGRLTRLDPKAGTFADAVALPDAGTRPWFTAAGDSLWVADGEGHVARYPMADLRTP